MWASWNGHLEVVRTLLEGGVNENAKTNVRNQMMIIVIMMMIIFVNDEDGDVCR